MNISVNTAAVVAVGMNTSTGIIMGMITAAADTSMNMSTRAADADMTTVIPMTTAIPTIMAAAVAAVTTTGIPVRAEA